MSLTYNPFESSTELRELGADLQMNVGDPERVAGGIAGFALLATSTHSHGIRRWGVVGAGVALLLRSWSGQCAWYRATGQDSRHPSRGVPPDGGTETKASVETSPQPEPASPSGAASSQ